MCRRMDSPNWLYRGGRKSQPDGRKPEDPEAGWDGNPDASRFFGLYAGKQK